MRRGSRLFSWAALLTAGGLLPPVAIAQQEVEERYIERQELDPQTGEWREAAPASQPVEGPLENARRLLVTGEQAAARKELEAWLESPTDNDRYYEGVYLLGEALFQKPDYWAAYEKFDEVASATSGELYYKSLIRSVDCARAFLSGQKRIVWKVLRLPAYDDGVEILDRVWETAPGTRIAEDALKLKADYYFATGELDLAQDEYVNLVNEFPNGKYLSYGMLRAAESAAAAFPGVKFDDRALVEAETRYKQFETDFPGLAEREQVAVRLEGIREQRAEKDLEIGKWYDKTGQQGAAEFYYRMVLSDYAGTLASAEARQRLQALGVAVESPPTQPASGPAGAVE
jgi:tetratricopeptide (TPR) repeat protein